MAALILALLPVLSVLQPAQATSYGLTRNYQGQNFFDGWNFYNKIDDLTHGNVMYVFFSFLSGNGCPFTSESSD